MVYRTQHFGILERCECGAYRYLTLRELKNSIEILKIHQTRNPNKRLYRVVARIPKSALKEHQRSNKAARDGDSLLESLSRAQRELTGVITKLKK